MPRKKKEEVQEEVQLPEAGAPEIIEEDLDEEQPDDDIQPPKGTRVHRLGNVNFRVVNN